MNLARVFHLVFPIQCLNCEAPLKGGVLCAPCHQTITLNRTLFCGRCGSRLPRGAKICHYDIPYVLGAAGEYTDPVLRSLIYSLKFRHVRGAAEILGTMLHVYVTHVAVQCDDGIVLPIPLGRRRARERGFNQSELIAEHFTRRSNQPLMLRNLIRSRDTAPQSGLGGRTEREKNVAFCFTLRDPAKIKDKNVILIDDVTTSGATFFEAARLLKNSGAKRILALAIAKAR